MRRFYIHIVAGLERLADPEGGNFADLKEAIEEARENAIEIASNELRAGRLFPRSWLAQVVDEDDKVLATFSFNELLGDYHRTKPNHHSTIMESVARVARKADTNCKDVRDGLAQAWLQLTRLKALSARFPAG